MLDGWTQGYIVGMAMITMNETIAYGLKYYKKIELGNIFFSNGIVQNF
jgi:hypothetical protein